MNGGLHHLHIRQRLARGLEPFPARSVWKRLLDRTMLIVAVLSPLALLPQTVRIFADGNASGLSLPTWVSLTLINVLWTVYGFAHRDKPIFIASSLIALLDVAIVFGILKYS